MAKLLVVDDEPNIVFSLSECLSSPTLRVVTATNAREAIDQVRLASPDVVILDVRLPDMSGLDAYTQIRQIDPRLPVIVMTAFAKAETAIEAMRRGAFDYLLKPVDLRRLREVLNKALEVSRLSHVPAVMEDDSPDDMSADRIVGQSPAMQEVYKAIGRFAAQDSTVLILGESGTGKELVARAIYHYSRRSMKPFLAINCAALTESLLESELFGHERGAFTGADQRHIGKFEQVNGGTIFLDEIGDMSPATQAKALRLLQEQKFERVGGNITVQTDVRIIAATNKDLATLVAEGKFRPDLFYRINGFTIRLPLLRERKTDIPLLVDHFIRRFNGHVGKEVRMLSDEARELLLAHDWPGNVRELQSAIRFAMVHATSDVITPDCLPHECAPRPPESGDSSLVSSEGGADFGWNLPSRAKELIADGQGDLYRRLLAEFDELVIRLALEKTRGNQLQAAELLGISRMTLRSKLRARHDSSPLATHADE